MKTRPDGGNYLFQIIKKLNSGRPQREDKKKPKWETVTKNRGTKQNQTLTRYQTTEASRQKHIKTLKPTPQ